MPLGTVAPSWHLSWWLLRPLIDNWRLIWQKMPPQQKNLHSVTGGKLWQPFCGIHFETASIMQCQNSKGTCRLKMVGGPQPYSVIFYLFINLTYILPFQQVGLGWVISRVKTKANGISFQKQYNQILINNNTTLCLQLEQEEMGGSGSYQCRCWTGEAQ